MPQTYKVPQERVDDFLKKHSPEAEHARYKNREEMEEHPTVQRFKKWRQMRDVSLRDVGHRLLARPCRRLLERCCRGWQVAAQGGIGTLRVLVPHPPPALTCARSCAAYSQENHPDAGAAFAGKIPHDVIPHLHKIGKQNKPRGDDNMAEL